VSKSCLCVSFIYKEERVEAITTEGSARCVTPLIESIKLTEMKYRVNYTYFNQAVNEKAKWEQREKDFDKREDAILFADKIAQLVSARNINIQPVP